MTVGAAVSPGHRSPESKPGARVSRNPPSALSPQIDSKPFARPCLCSCCSLRHPRRPAMGEYRVRVATGAFLGSGTWDNVSVSLVGPAGESPALRLDSLGKDFNRGAVSVRAARDGPLLAAAPLPHEPSPAPTPRRRTLR